MNKLTASVLHFTLVVEFPRGTDSADALRLGVAAISALKKMGHTDAEAHHFDTEGILWMEFPNLPAELGIRATERCVNRIINGTGRRLD